MMFVDTGAWYALSVSTDEHHQASQSLYERHVRRFVTTDYVIDETLTLLRARGEMRERSGWGTCSGADGSVASTG